MKDTWHGDFKIVNIVGCSIISERDSEWSYVEEFTENVEVNDNVEISTWGNVSIVMYYIFVIGIVSYSSNDCTSFIEKTQSIFIDMVSRLSLHILWFLMNNPYV